MAYRERVFSGNLVADESRPHDAAKAEDDGGDELQGHVPNIVFV